MEAKSSYRSILKATSVFGGVQVFNILITLIRGKAVAVLLGPNGMGLNGLFLSGLNLIKTLTSLGIAESAVRNLALTHGKDDQQFKRTFTVFKSWIWVTAGLGMLCSIMFAPLLSRFAFGDETHAVDFMWLSVTFIFGALTGGIYTVLRASRKISQLAKANIYGSISGLLVTLPILYVWGIKGVMPSIVAASFVSFLVSLLFRRYVNVEAVELSLKERFLEGKPMVTMGINMSLSVLLGSVTAFVLNSFITRMGGLKDLGLFSAANSIMTGYVGMVFTAMSADYFPRLSQAISNREEWKNVINQQAEILILILTIVLSLMMGSVSLLIKLLLSEDFLEISGFLLILGLSIPLKGLVWSLGYLYLSKGDSKMYLAVEFIANIIFLAFNLAGYYFFGLQGIAVAQVISYLLSLLFNSAYIYKKYIFRFSNDVIKTSILSILALTGVFISSVVNAQYIHVLSWVLISVAVGFSLYAINNKIDLLNIALRKLGIRK